MGLVQGDSFTSNVCDYRDACVAYVCIYSIAWRFGRLKWSSKILASMVSAADQKLSL